MQTLIAFIFLACFILFIISLFSAQKGLFWYKGPRTKKRALLIYGLGIILLAIIGGAVAPETNDLSQQSISNETPTQKKAPEFKKIKDEVAVGDFAYRVDEIKFQKKIGGDMMSSTADGIYLLIGLSVQNNSKETKILDSSMFKVTNEDGVKYEPSINGITAVEMNGGKTVFMKQCQPGITTSGILVYEVPDKKVYDLHLSGGLWSGATEIIRLIE